MCKLNLILFLIFLVPHRQALVEGQLSLVDPELTSVLLGEIDGFLNELSLNHKALLDVKSLCPKSKPKSDVLDGKYKPDGNSMALVQDKFKELKVHLGSQTPLKECEYILQNIKSR
ncbi:uncharacterized protein [Drosophila kikkawai]|uniref:Uncharacterized protein n=1 Tax=Drosophila kikkawai TaxID=30033 RepID=A0A6P4IBH1_DROKI|nr:uncharacterized protein LOC108076987 [Drosophila kikkawai]